MPHHQGRKSQSHLEKDLDQNSASPRVKSERSLEEDNKCFWIKVDGQQKLATENLVIGNQVYQEKLVTKKGIEYRLWDPFRSKLAAAIMNGLKIFPFEEKSKVLYLGVSTGTTVSHISDIVGPTGIIFGVEHASRVARDFLDRVASHRSNIMPVLQDAKSPKRIIEEEIEKMKVHFEILQVIDLHPYDKDHAIVIAKFLN